MIGTILLNRYKIESELGKGACEGLSESEFNAAWAEDQSMSQEQVFALAKEIL